MDRIGKRLRPQANSIQLIWTKITTIAVLERIKVRMVLFVDVYRKNNVHNILCYCWV